MADTITKIQPSDLISDSMVKINRNFEIISAKPDVIESKLNQWAENIENKLADIRNENGIISSTLLNNVQKLENKINNLTDLDGITKEVQNIIYNATIDVENLINDKADEAISSKLGDYVKTSTLNERLDGYVASTAFDTYRSDSSKSFAQSSRIVANSKFLKLPNGNDDCLVRIGGEITTFESVEDYFKIGLPAADKAAILGDKTFSSDDKALEDPDVVAKLIEVCEKTFKTVVSEMSTISQEVGDGFAESSIIATVNKNGKSIVSSIFVAANDKGSSIALNADHINIEGDHALTVKSTGNINIESGGNFIINSGGKFQITSDNFNIDSKGEVTVKGAIKATSLEITGSDGLMVDIGDETKLANFVKKHQNTVSGSTSYDDKWLRDALNSSTTINGGLVLSNAILTQDSANKITAGMIGSNISENDVRFFAGTSSTDLSVLESAPFRVYEDGSIIASKGMIGGLKISDNSLTTENGNFSVSSDGNLIAKSGVFSGFLRMPFKTFDEGATYNSSDHTYTVSNCFNLNSYANNESGPYQVTLKLPNSSDYSGTVLTIFDSPIKTKSSPELIITCESGAYIYHPSKKGTYGLDPANSISCPRGGIIQFVGVETYGYTYWFVITDMTPDAVVS